MFGLGKDRHVANTLSDADLNVGIEPTADRYRIGEVDRLTWALLQAQAARAADNRNGELVDALLDIRRALDLPMPIRPHVRPAVPVVPGGEGGSR
jgi:hypothetical protein